MHQGKALYDYIKKNRLNRAEIAEKIGVERTVLYAYFKSEELRDTTLDRLRAYFGNDIYNIIEEPKVYLTDTLQEPMEVYDDREYIEKAQAGYQRKRPVMYAGDIPPEFRPNGDENTPVSKFIVEGNSMEPTLYHGDNVYARLTDVRNFKPDYVHVVVPKRVTGRGTVIKRVIRKGDRLVCFSDNKEGEESYRTYVINIEDVSEIWHVYAVLTRHLPKPSELYERVLELEAELRLLRADFDEYVDRD